MPDTDLSEKYVTIFLFGKSNKTVFSEYLVMVIPEILLGCFHYWDDVRFVGRVGVFTGSSGIPGPEQPTLEQQRGSFLGGC